MLAISVSGLGLMGLGVDYIRYEMAKETPAQVSIENEELLVRKGIYADLYRRFIS